jgi:CRISPR/Cas system endoribonuclease Cas6 (RAMP superfamily)
VLREGGVTSEIYQAIGRGDTVEARFRAADDTLYEIHILQFANGQLTDRARQAAPSPVP